MYILGISAYYHDSAAALIKDGHIIAAAQEERFTRKKHDAAFPINAVEYCLSKAEITAEQLDHVIFYEKPLLKFERLLETYFAYAPRGFKQFISGLPIWLKQKLHLRREMSKALGNAYKGRYIFCEHHESHAASAFFPGPFQQAAIMTFDGVGEWATASLGYGKDNSITITDQMHFPHSLGLLYSSFTYFTGFRVNSGEYKLMGLAPYGKPKYKDLILDNLIDLKDDGSLRLNMDYFTYCHGMAMTGSKFEKLFGIPRRKSEDKITQQQMDIAASIQAVTELVVLKAANHLHQKTGMKNLVLAGGVALNCVSNGRILRESPFEKIWIQPAAGDAGGALGAALFVWHQLLGNERIVSGNDTQYGSLLGPSFDDDSIARSLDTCNAKYVRFDSDDDLITKVAELIADEKVVGWFQGAMEFGPRALGNRSIIGDARSTKMQSIMNLKIKFRESFRPFAPSVLREDADSYFQIQADQDSPYMLIVAPVRPEIRTQTEGYQDAEGFDKLNLSRSSIQAVTHVDYSARLQTVDSRRNPRYHKLISKFKEKTGCPVIINTSFNIRGEPIVCTPKDAYRCFMATDMDILVVGNLLMYKQDQESRDKNEISDYKSQFELD